MALPIFQMPSINANPPVADVVNIPALSSGQAIPGSTGDRGATPGPGSGSGALSGLNVGHPTGSMTGSPIKQDGNLAHLGAAAIGALSSIGGFGPVGMVANIARQAFKPGGFTSTNQVSFGGVPGTMATNPGPIGPLMGPFMGLASSMGAINAQNLSQINTKASQGKPGYGIGTFEGQHVGVSPGPFGSGSVLSGTIDPAYNGNHAVKRAIAEALQKGAAAAAAKNRARAIDRNAPPAAPGGQTNAQRGGSGPGGGGGGSRGSNGSGGYGSQERDRTDRRDGKGGK